MRTRTLNATWGPFMGVAPRVVDSKSRPYAALHARMRHVLESWIGTRYHSGQSCKGVSADCVGFALSAVDELDGRPRACPALLPSDAAFHDPESAREAVATIRRLYEPAELLRGPGIVLEPFDIVVVGTAGGGPGHIMLVGPSRNTLWHCSNVAGVNRTGWALGDGYERLHAAYRLSDRSRWLR